MTIANANIATSNSRWITLHIDITSDIVPSNSTERKPFWECKCSLSRLRKFSVLYATRKFVVVFARTCCVVWKTYKQLVPEVKEEMYLRTCVFILLGIYIRRRKVSFPCLFISRSYTEQSSWFIRVPRDFTHTHTHTHTNKEDVTYRSGTPESVQQKS